MNVSDLKTNLPDRRWFGGKGREIADVSLVDHAILDEGPPRLALAIVQVSYRDGDPDLYHLPLLTRSDGSTIDAFDEIEQLVMLGGLLAHGNTIKTTQGAFHFSGAGLDPLHPPGSESVRSVGKEQSNTSLVFDEKIILKLFRKLAVGPNPDLELNRLLTDDGFQHVPEHVGEITYAGTWDGEDVEIDLGLAQRFLDDSVEGWEEMLGRLDELLSKHGSDEVDDLRDAVAEYAERSLDLMGELGSATAELHVLLAREELAPEVAAEPIEPSDLKTWAESTRGSLTTLLDAGIDQLRDRAEEIEARLDRLAALEDPGSKSRIHGDYHLGQVMLTQRGWMILDLEGEPARTLDERRAKYSPLKDVAGMLRSLGYAAAASLFAKADPDSDDWARLEPWALAWEDLARDRFLASYLRTAHEGQYLPSEREAIEVMLDVFELDKALYEISYELNHRPDWLRIPLRGISEVLDRKALL